MWFGKIKDWLGLSSKPSADKAAISSEAAPEPMVSEVSKTPQTKGKSKSKAKKKTPKKRS